jgi:nitrate reductase NapAB chaperone NapD
MSIIGKVIAVFGILTLCACAGATPEPILQQDKKTQLEIAQTPLTLENIQFQVMEKDGKLVIVMTLDEYAKLAKNMEDIQMRLHIDHVIINKQTEYYNN